MPKIPEISVAIQMERSVSVSFDRNIRDHLWRWSTYFERKLARLITQYRDIFFPIFRKAQPSFFRVLQRMTKVFNVTSLKYGKYDITNEKINNNKRLIDRAKK